MLILSSRSTRVGTIAMVSFGLLILFVLYFCLRETASMVQLRLDYWNTYWAYAEWAIILGTFSFLPAIPWTRV
jgi:hypothetical protein